MTDSKHEFERAVAKAEHRLPALAVSHGIGIGRVALLCGEGRPAFRLDLDAGEIEAELKRFQTALDESIGQLRELAGRVETDPARLVSDIFGVHLLILESSFVERITAAIRDQNINAEWAIRTTADQYLERQRAVADSHFRDKYLDIDDVANRLLSALVGSTATAQTAAGAVIIARELRPSTIMELAKSRPAALITEYGGWTSHSSILARELGLPMVSGVRNLEHSVLSGDQIIVDGENGLVILNPGVETLRQYSSLRSIAPLSETSNGRISNVTSTLDGVEIVIRANVDVPDGYARAQHIGATGIGLFRSESLIRRPGVMPSEAEQVSAYRQIAGAAGEAGVRIRTFDIGMDGLHGEGHSAGPNPALGLRAIRLSLSELTEFRIQVRAILRASFDSKIDIILPMVSGVSEILLSKVIIAEESERLSNDGIDVGEPKLGVMIETPSAVLTAREIARNVDFMCLGTNDLVQYLLAVDRDNDAVAAWYQTLHPAVVRALREVIASAVDEGIPLSICGEMAGSPFYLPVLIGLGARELSMNAHSIPAVRNLLSGISTADAVELVGRIDKLDTAETIEVFLREYYLQHWSGLFPDGLLSTRYR